MLTLPNNSTELRYPAEDGLKVQWRRPVPCELCIIQSCAPSFLSRHSSREGWVQGVSHSMLEDRQTFRGGAYIMITGFQRFPVNTKHLYNICNKLSFHHLKLRIALAIQALNECKIKTNNSAT